MKASKLIISLAFLSILCSCSSSAKEDNADKASNVDEVGNVDEAGNVDITLSERELYRYEQALSTVEQAEKLCEQIEATQSQEDKQSLLLLSANLSYEYNEYGMNQATIGHCNSLKTRVEKCRSRAEALLAGTKSNATNVANLLETTNVSTNLSATTIRALDEEDILLTEIKSIPIYLYKGETLLYKISTEGATVKLYNADAERLIKSFSKKEITDSLIVKNSGIYQLVITPKSKQYVSITLDIRVGELGHTNIRPTIKTKQVECSKGDIGAIAVTGINMQKCFEEPRKCTLRSQLKAAFSGGSKAVVAVKVPAGATDILYSLRIDTSESSRAEDGKFHDNLTRSYTQVKFLGLPLYEKSNSNGLLNTLLDDNRPIRKEDAYCNLFVFRSQSQAKKFQDGTSNTSTLNYDVDYSTIGTQSCNGSIPTNGSKTIYLGFENERMRYTNYIWVEVEAVIPQTIYYKSSFSIE